jgi:hypothetical protein
MRAKQRLEEKEFIRDALDHLAEALCFAYETKTSEGNALAFMIDSAVKYGQVIYRDHDVLSAASDYTAYEDECYKEFLQRQ